MHSLVPVQSSHVELRFGHNISVEEPRAVAVALPGSLHALVLHPLSCPPLGAGDPVLGHGLCVRGWGSAARRRTRTHPHAPPLGSGGSMAARDLMAILSNPSPDSDPNIQFTLSSFECTTHALSPATTILTALRMSMSMSMSTSMSMSMSMSTP